MSGSTSSTPTVDPVATSFYQGAVPYSVGDAVAKAMAWAIGVGVVDPINYPGALSSLGNAEASAASAAAAAASLAGSNTILTSVTNDLATVQVATTNATNAASQASLSASTATAAAAASAASAAAALASQNAASAAAAASAASANADCAAALAGKADLVNGFVPLTELPYTAGSGITLVNGVIASSFNPATKADLVGGMVPLTELPYTAGPGIVINGGAISLSAGAISLSAGAGSAGSLGSLLGWTPPTAAQFTYWFQQTNPAGSTYASGPAVSSLTDTPEGLLVSMQPLVGPETIRLFGMPCPSTPHEAVLGITLCDPSLITSSALRFGGPMYFKESNLKGLWSPLWIGNTLDAAWIKQTVSMVQLQNVTGNNSNVASFTGTPSGTAYMDPGDVFLAFNQIFYRSVMDSAGNISIYFSTASKNGPWFPLYTALMDSALGGTGSTGYLPDVIGFAADVGWPGAPVMRNLRFLVNHWQITAYSGPATPGIPPTF